MMLDILTAIEEATDVANKYNLDMKVYTDFDDNTGEEGFSYAPCAFNGIEQLRPWEKIVKIIKPMTGLLPQITGVTS